MAIEIVDFSLQEYKSYKGSLAYPLVICYRAIDHDPFIVDYLLKTGIFHSYVNVYQRVV